MDRGYTDNGFIVDLSHARKTSEIIYELSRILDMQEAKGRQICLKLGLIDLSKNELNSIRALVELMESKLSFISTGASKTLEAADELGISVSEFTSEISAPVFQPKNPEPAPEVVQALDNIFGEQSSDENIPVEEQKSDLPSDNVGIAKNAAEVNEIDKIEIEESEVDEEIIALQNQAQDLPTSYIKRTIRSGQSISSDGNILIIGDVNPGAEIIAKGDITVWGILSGIAHAGSDGNKFARIRALKLNPVQIRIGDVFARRPDTVNVPFVQKTSEYTPEEAFTHNGNIIIKKYHEIKEK